MPLSTFARPERGPANGDEPVAVDDLHRMIDGLRIPPNVAAISSPRGVRIRRVRVPALKQPANGNGGDKRPVILSRRALRDSSEDIHS
jgi:hypothetical protein